MIHIALSFRKINNTLLFFYFVGSSPVSGILEAYQETITESKNTLRME